MSADELLKKIQSQLGDIEMPIQSDSNKQSKRNTSNKDDVEFIDVILYFKKKISNNMKYILPFICIYVFLMITKPFFVMETKNTVKDSKIYKRKYMNHKKIMGSTFVIYVLIFVMLLFKKNNILRMSDFSSPY